MSSNIHTQFLCSGADDRKILDSLWNFVLTKKFKNPDDLPALPVICRTLAKEFAMDHMNRTRFCASTHIIYATVNLYRIQVNKLYNQAKTALDTCNRTFFHDHWLLQFVDEDASQVVPSNDSSNYEEASQLHKKSALKSKQKKNTAASSNPLSAQLNLIDRVFEIEDDDEEAEWELISAKGVGNKKKKSWVNSANNLVDSRTARLNEITMIDKVDLEVKFNKAFDNVREDEFLEFDHDFLDEMKTIYQSNQLEVDIDQEIPELEHPDHLMDNPYQQLHYFQNQIIDVIKAQVTPQRKRLSSTNIEHRVNAKVPRIDKQNLPDAELPKSCISASPSPMINQSPHTAKVAVPKQKARKRKLIIDKKTQIEKNFPGPTPQVQSPIDAFGDFFARHKYSIEKLFASPASRAKGKTILSIFKRCLKTVPECNQNKVEFNEAGDPVSPPKKKRIEFENDHSFMVNRKTHQKVNVIAEPEQLLKNREIDMSFPEGGLLEHPVEVDSVFNDHNEQNNLEDSHSADNGIPPVEADASSEGLSIRCELMIKLSDFWNRTDFPITMNELCFGLTSVIAARMFLELMILSKFEAIELIQGENLHIADIKKGTHFKIKNFAIDFKM